nr:MAG TPA: hypothetical protein [Caudoviricetes sp.]
MTEGQIPWNAVEEWGRSAGMNREEREDLWLAIAAMDNVYLDHKAKQLAQNAQANIPAKTK